jgi:hypothetical protein
LVDRHAAQHRLQHRSAGTVLKLGLTIPEIRCIQNSHAARTSAKDSAPRLEPQQRTVCRDAASLESTHLAADIIYGFITAKDAILSPRGRVRLTKTTYCKNSQRCRTGRSQSAAAAEVMNDNDVVGIRPSATLGYREDRFWSPNK